MGNFVVSALREAGLTVERIGLDGMRFRKCRRRLDLLVRTVRPHAVGDFIMSQGEQTPTFERNYSFAITARIAPHLGD